MSKKEIQNRQNLRIKEIALFIKNWRINEGLSQREFSKLANVHVNSISNLERQMGSNLITILKCIRAMDNMTLSEFFTGIE
jgi:transcriptional regulator with XRE-family HTH domain